jgi:transposase
MSHRVPGVVRDLLDLPGYKMVGVDEEDEDHIVISAEVLHPKINCQAPACHSKDSLDGHGTYSVEFDDSGNGKRRQVRVTVHRRMCRICKATCSDELPGLDPDFRATRRLTEHVERQIDRRETDSKIAVDTGFSVATIRRIAVRQMNNRPTDMLTIAPTEAGFDEKHFKGKVIFVAMRTKPRGRWEVLEDTSQKTIEKFFASITNREALLIANMDFTLTIKDLVEKWFPNAKVVIDPFHVVAELIECLPKIRKAEGRRLYSLALKELQPKLSLLTDNKEKKKLGQKTQKQVNKRISALQRDRSLIEMKRWELELGSADDIKVQNWLMEMPLLKEFYDLLQNLYELYRSRITPEKAAAAISGWFDGLSAKVLKCVKKFVNLVRGHMTDVCAFWPDGSSNGYTESINGSIEDIERTRGNIAFARARDVMLYSESPTSILQKRRAKRQEEREPGEKHASVRPVRRPLGDIERAPERRNRKRLRRRRQRPNHHPHDDQFGLSIHASTPQPAPSKQMPAPLTETLDRLEQANSRIRDYASDGRDDFVTVPILRSPDES